MWQAGARKVWPLPDPPLPEETQLFLQAEVIASSHLPKELTWESPRHFSQMKAGKKSFAIWTTKLAGLAILIRIAQTV